MEDARGVIETVGDFKAGSKFSSFEELQTKLKVLTSDYCYPIHVFNSQTVEDYNKKRLKAKTPIEPIDKRWKYTYYSVRCVHYGKPRLRSKGIRPKQRHLAIDCPFKITVSFDRVLNCLIVRDSCLQHSHRVGKEILKHYPSQCKLTEAEQADVKTAISLKANTKHLKDHIQKKYGKFLTLRDVYNIRVKGKEMEKNGQHDAQNVIDILSSALGEDQYANGGVTVNEENQLEVLYYQSGHMLNLFQKFPEILLIDGTYNVNKVGMPLYCFMVEDGFGHGQPVYYAALAEEDGPHLQSMIQTFKECNPAWNNTKVIVIDKDFSEWKSLSLAFPDADILFCQFHVIKYLFKKVVDCEVPKDQREEVREFIRHLVHAKTQEQYEEARDDLLKIMGKEFESYILENWENCIEM